MKISTTPSRTTLNSRTDSFSPAPKPAATERPRWGYSAESSFESKAPTIAREEPRPQVMSQELDDLVSRPVTHTITGPQPLESANIRGERMPADLYEVEVRGHRIPVTVGHGELEPGMQQPSIEEVAQALARLPDEALREIEAVQISPHRNPEDGHWAKKYEDPDFRSAMTTGSAGVTTVYPHPHELDDAGMAASLLHETTHAWTNREWGERGTERDWQRWASAAAADGHVMSDYATESVKEDVSETAALYLATRGTREFDEARALYPHRFAILDERFGAEP